MDNRKRNLILLSVIFASSIILIYFKCREADDLRKNGVIVKAKIVKVLSPYKGGVYYSFYCEFEYQGVKRKAISISKIQKEADTFLGKSFPAIYSNNTNTLRLLITSDD